MRTRTLLLLTLLVVLVVGPAVAAPPAPGRLATLLTGGDYTLSAGPVMSEAAPSSTVLASGGAYRLLGPAAPEDASGCCCKCYLPLLLK